MANDDQTRRPERPRAEPEIIPPGHGPRGPGPGRSFESVFVHVDGRDGTQRVYVARPRGWSLVLTLFIVGLVAAFVLLLLAGLVLLWLPVLAAIVVIALLSGSLRGRWQQLRAWLASRGV